MLLTSPSEFRPAPPPACDSAEGQAEMAIVSNYPRALTTANFLTNAKAFFWQSPAGLVPWSYSYLNRWILEDGLDANPPRSARVYALLGVVSAITSSPVKTPSTPGAARAASTSMERMWAWAKGLRRKAACTSRGSCTSST